MTRLMRTSVCIGAGIVFGRIGLIVGAVLLPLAFPLSLESSEPETTAVTVMAIIMILFSVAGVAFCWKLTDPRG